MGVPELESGTSSLSATRSNQLSYTPVRVRSRDQRRRSLGSFFCLSKPVRPRIGANLLKFLRCAGVRSNRTSSLLQNLVPHRLCRFNHWQQVSRQTGELGMRNIRCKTHDPFGAIRCGSCSHPHDVTSLFFWTSVSHGVHYLIYLIRFFTVSLHL